LPERPATVERLREEPARELGELDVVAGGTEHVPHHVVADVEARVRLPGGVSEAEGHADRALRVARDQVQPRCEVRELALEIERAGDRIEAADVQQLPRPLEVEERRIDAAQAVAGSLKSGHGASGS